MVRNRIPLSDKICKKIKEMVEGMRRWEEFEGNPGEIMMEKARQFTKKSCISISYLSSFQLHVCSFKYKMSCFDKVIPQ
ncbi:MAG: hypothetical protein NC932_03395 [Candidatus Omnitrophica bacterium]|nr:hypothetical protein [Candidatus Omnitrophota bacterium]